MSWFTKKEKDKEERFILSLDGGGIRGIVTSVILSHLSQGLKERGDMRPLYSHFDLIAGTSTGALLALGLAIDGLDVKQDEGPLCPVTHIEKTGLFSRQTVTDGFIARLGDPEAFTELYMKNASGIFSSKGNFLSQVFSTKYDTASYEKFLRNTFCDTCLEDAMVPCLVITYDSMAGCMRILSSYNEYRDMKACDAARASSAAPVYFPPFYAADGHSLLDGGIVANNPALAAYTEAQKLYPECEVFHILSLSTARGVYRFNPKDGIPGIAGWAEPVMKMYPNAQMDFVNRVLSDLGNVDYVRIEGTVSKEKIKMDDTRPESLKTLVSGGEKLWQDNRDRLDAFLSTLSETKTTDSVRLIKRIPART